MNFGSTGGHPRWKQGARRLQISRGWDIHTANVAARARAPLVMHVRAGLRRLVRLIPGVGARIERAEAAAYEEAARQAFRAGTSIDAPRPVAPPTAVVPQSELVTHPLGSLAARPADLKSEPPKWEPGVTGAVAAVSADVGQTPAPKARPADEPAVAERSARRNRRRAGETAPDHLLRSPTGGTPVVDDFFDGLIRRVMGDR